MSIRSQITLLATLAITLAGCATSQPTVVEVEPLGVPSTAMYASSQRALNAYQVLAGTNTPDYFFGRNEKVVYGAYPIAGISSFTSYAYDSQRISTPGGSGYQYRWVVQNGISSPLAP